MTIRLNEDIALKRIESTDALSVFQIIDDNRASFRIWLPFVDFTLSVQDTINYINSIYEPKAANQELVFVVIYKQENVGLIGFKDTDKSNKKTEIGYWLSEKAQGKGIMTQCVQYLIDCAFEVLDINRIQIKCAVKNSKSLAIPERLGFKLEGVERDGELLVDNIFTDLNVYSLIKRSDEINPFVF
jgi:ribosomal-protein-serine acetyltransferase